MGEAQRRLAMCRSHVDAFRSCAAEQLIQPERGIAWLSSFFLAIRLNVARPRPVNSGVRQLRGGETRRSHGRWKRFVGWARFGVDTQLIAAEQIVGRERNQRACHRQLGRNVVVSRRVNSTVGHLHLR